MTAVRRGEVVIQHQINFVYFFKSDGRRVISESYIGTGKTHFPLLALR